jgi:hypothetical protein
VEKGAKLAQRSIPLVHGNLVAFKTCKTLMQNLWRKTLYSIFESGKG